MILELILIDFFDNIILQTENTIIPIIDIK